MDTAPIKRLLIVDDEAIVTMTLANSLQSLSDEYQVDVAHDGLTALDMVRATPYHILITDYRMPGLNGLDLARQVREICPATHILMMTAYGSENLRQAARQLALTGFIDKPFSIGQIRDAVLPLLSGQSPNNTLALVIEDNEDIATLFSRALIMEGFFVEVISDGLQAQHRLQTAKPALIVLDIHLPGVDGVTLLKQIRRARHLTETIVFVATADPFQTDFNKDSADLVLQKPVTFSQLRDFSRRFKKQ